METDHRLSPAHYPILPTDCSLHSSSSQQHRQTYPCSSAAPTSDAYQRQPFGSNTEPASHVEDIPSTQRKRRRLVNQPIIPKENRTRPGLLPTASCPFLEDFNGAWWNAQALFASDVALQSDKHRLAWSLLNKSDFTGYAETHSTTGHVVAASLPATAKFFWSHAPTRSQAGIAVAVKHSFLERFNPVDDASWEEIEPGRVARLKLRGPNGALDIYACYFPTGTSSEEQEHKRQLVQKLKRSVAPRDAVLSVLMGD